MLSAAMMVSAVVVPMDGSRPLESVSIPAINQDDTLETLIRDLQLNNNPVPTGAIAGNVLDVRQRLLIRSGSNGTAGLYAYDVLIEPSPTDQQHATRSPTQNVRATRLAMACGLFSQKLWGNVLLVRASIVSRVDLDVDDVVGACCISPDLRENIQNELQLIHQQKPHTNTRNDNPQQNTVQPPRIPDWLGNALQQNYHDKAVLSKLANVMTTIDDKDSDDDSSSDSDGSNNDTANQKGSEAQSRETETSSSVFVTKQPLCLHCRRPASTLCPGCKACYFCDTSDKNCRRIGWTHECLCSTWKLYEDRRTELSTFPFLGAWTQELTTDAFHSSEKPYEDFLKRYDLITATIHDMDNGGDNGGHDENTATSSASSSSSSWWSTELFGWAGGKSKSAQTVDMSIRKSYAQGFAPLSQIPPQRRMEEEDIHRANKSMVSEENSIHRNSLGLLHLTSWEQYYKLRDIPASSPAALLCTFPLTVYYAITNWGEVPSTVARMLQRPLRIHIVGVEKEANFLDLFQEVGYLLPVDFKVELTCVVRDDMLPPKSQQKGTKSVHLTINLCDNLSLNVVSGTYGDSLDPNWDCGTAGPPDMIIALNAGLFAYESWRSVVTYLYINQSVIGVFSDYNEYSGVNCAGLGGKMGRESLCVNPFRQPRAMPVYSMNLPQFSNGFLYVINAQELE